MNRPPSGRLRVVCAPAFALPESVERGDYWAITGFDPILATQTEWQNLKKPRLLFLPSDRHLEACVSHGIGKERMFRFPLGIDHGVFRPGGGPSTLVPDKKEFRFLFLGNPLFRKGLDLVLKAFITEFKPQENVRLVVKLTHLPKMKKHLPYEIPDLVRRLGGLNRMFPEVTVISQLLPEKDYARLVASCDVLVNGNRSFTTGLPVMEAMACGLPVIGPEPLRELAGLREETGFPLPVRMTVVPAGRLFPDSPECSVGEVEEVSLRNAMRAAFSRPDETTGKGRNACRQAKKVVGWENFGKLLKEAAVSRS